jgi:hypothetical protein
LRTSLFALLSVSALPIAAAVTLSAAPATAAESACGHYPPGNAYGLRGGNGKHDGKVDLNARVTYPGTPEKHCGGKSVSYFVSGNNEVTRDSSGRVTGRKYHLSGGATSNADGLARLTKTAPRNNRQAFYWYAAYASDNGTGTAQSAPILVRP